ncbi:MAG: hypothetical protein PWP68_525 [Rikenellaceae bacterium]|nr:hypothetical protein [Rikenellaceae bacterium]
MNKNYSTTKLCYKLLDDSYLDENGKIKEELKFKIDVPSLNIKNSKFIGKPENKFETMLFLPEGEGRQGEGGLRTKGYFKFSYVKRERLDVRGETSDSLLYNDIWYIADFNGNPVTPASEHIQQQIQSYISRLTSHVSPITSLPLITVITVVYNGAKYLEETIQSVINQTYPNVEYIIIDGGSTDGTLDIIKKYEDYIDYWISEKDKGIYDAMNKGVMVAGGYLIAMLNVGDRYELDACTKIIKAVFKEPEIDGIYGDSVVYSDEGKILYRRIAENFDYVVKSMPAFHPEIFIKNKVYKILGFYQTKYKVAADYEFLLRVFLSGFKFTKVNDVILHYRLGGFSGRNYINGKKEMIKIKKNYKIQTLRYTYIEIIKYFVKKLFLINDDSLLLQIYRKIFHKNKVVVMYNFNVNRK